MPFKQLSKKVAFKNPYYSVYEEEYSLPNGAKSTYYAVRDLKTVFVVPLLNKSELILTKQYRYLYQNYSWEFPAGRIDPGETAEVAALRELEEESGYKAAHLKSIGWFAPCNGLSDEHCSVFLATELQYTTQQLEATEDITVAVIAIDEFERMIENSEVQDGMTLAAWTFAKKHIL